jgi:hypothetical protein
VEPWAIGLRRSVERTRIPTKGILKRTIIHRICFPLLIRPRSSLDAYRRTTRTRIHCQG